MSSPKGAKPKVAKPMAAKPAPAGKPASAGKTARAAKPASDEGMTARDKANFVKAMLEGIKPKDAPKKAAAGKSAPAEAPKKVEILRRIPAASRVARPTNPESEQAKKLAALVEEKVAAGELEVLTPEAVQALMAALCKFYSANMEAGNKYPVVEGRLSITGTDAMIVCGALLKAVDLQVFELGMWQSWAGV